MAVNSYREDEFMEIPTRKNHAAAVFLSACV